jgi:uncharacterized protein (TIGR03663 family)
MDSFIVSGRRMQRAALIFCWMLVIATGAFLRFDDLSSRPFHADEATGARITAKRMESNGGTFDPKHYHGPLLGDFAIPICRMNGETGWKDMSKAALRAGPAIAGTLLLLVPLLWRRRCGDGPVLLAAALLATSPLLVYYSRMFIHETWLVLFGMLTLASLTRKPVAGLTGLLMGMMFGTKESFAISILAWTGAGIWLAIENRSTLNRATLLAGWREYRVSIAVSFAVAALVSGLIYTHGLRHPQGAVDAIRTFFVYETVEGHDKPFAYYLKLFAWPSKSGGVWWFGTPVCLLALIAYAATFRRSADGLMGRKTIRFLAYATLGHVLIYSLIAYKTPWLACLPWAHVCVLAGFAVVGFARRGHAMKFALAALILAALITQFQQTRRAIGRYASDERNPFAYVPTRRDVEALETWLSQVRAALPAGSLETVAVVGVDYWPLPWYLRSFDRIGYWKSASPELIHLPLIFALPDTTGEVSQVLEASHVPLPRGLRTGVPMHLFVRKDLWKQWMEAGRQ